MRYKKGELVIIQEIGNREVLSLCMVLRHLGSDFGLTDNYFMVYSITNREKFIVTSEFMKKCLT
jgi:hypothetical protein